MNTNKLPTPITRELEEIAADIRIRMRRTVEDIIHIGKGLLEAKSQLGYSGFGKWCDEQFADMTRETRSKFMQVAERFGNVRISDNLSASVYQLLASPSVPDDIVSEIFVRAEDGEKVTTATVRELFKQRRAPSSPVDRKQSANDPEIVEQHPLATLDELVTKLLLKGMTVEDIELAIHRTDSRISWLKPEQAPEPATETEPKGQGLVQRAQKAWKLIKMTEAVGITASDLHHLGFSSATVYSCLDALAKDIEREKAGIAPSSIPLPEDLVDYESDTVQSRRSLMAFKDKLITAYEPLADTTTDMSDDEVENHSVNFINVVRDEMGLKRLK